MPVQPDYAATTTDASLTLKPLVTFTSNDHVSNCPPFQVGGGPLHENRGFALRLYTDGKPGSIQHRSLNNDEDYRKNDFAKTNLTSLSLNVLYFFCRQKKPIE